MPTMCCDMDIPNISTRQADAKSECRSEPRSEIRGAIRPPKSPKCEVDDKDGPGPGRIRVPQGPTGSHMVP
jgi:hypothetical protein